MFLIGPAALILAADNDSLIIIDAASAVSHIMVLAVFHHIIFIIFIQVSSLQRSI
jgi:hypothetical protein